MLDRLLRKAGIADKADVRYLYDDAWTPPADDPFADSPRPASRETVDQWVAQSGTQAVVVMGEQPLALALGEYDVTRWQFFQVPHAWGTVIPLFAPSKYLAYRTEKEVDPDDVIGNAYKKERGVSHPPRFQGMARKLLQASAILARQKPPAPKKTKYLIDPDVATWERFVTYLLWRLAQDPELVLSYDIETAYHLKKKGEEDTDEETIDYDTTIIRISFAVVEGEAVSIPFTGPYLPGVRRLLESRFPKLGWNSWAFDELILAINDFPVLGLHYDGQDAWHMLYSDLPKGLEAVSAFGTDLLPWKHLGDINPGLYSCIDADAAVRNFYWIRRELKKANQWKLYLRQAVYLHPPLHAAGRNGLLVDDTYRKELQVAYEIELRQFLLDAQGMVAEQFRRKKLYKVHEEKVAVAKPVRLKKDGTPFKVREAKPKALKPVKEVPANKRRENWIWETTEIEHKRRICIACKRPNINRKHACKVDPEGWNRDYTKMFGEEVIVEKREYKAAMAPGAPLDFIKEWLKFNGFNPNSSSQVLDYMKAHRHPVGYNPKTEEDSADTKHLLKLAKKYGAKHPIYQHIVNTHRLAKALSTYVIGMAPDVHGMVYTTYVNATTTWRLASRNKNLQNQSKRAANPYAKKTRKMFISRYPRVREERIAA